jgi:hypothetical protein
MMMDGDEARFVVVVKVGGSTSRCRSGWAECRFARVNENLKEGLGMQWMQRRERRSRG